MTFLHAFAKLLSGKKVKRYNWKGFWEYDREADTIIMHTKEGSAIDIRETKEFVYTMLNILSNDWEEVE